MTGFYMTGRDKIALDPSPDRTIKAGNRSVRRQKAILALRANLLPIVLVLFFVVCPGTWNH